jgi:hypothetical protein
MHGSDDPRTHSKSSSASPSQSSSPPLQASIATQADHQPSSPQIRRPSV